MLETLLVLVLVLETLLVLVLVLVLVLMVVLTLNCTFPFPPSDSGTEACVTEQRQTGVRRVREGVRTARQQRVKC